MTERKEVSPDANAKSHTSQRTGSPSRSLHLAPKQAHSPHTEEEKLLKPAQWDSRDRELLSFHYPKGSVTVGITCLLFPRTLHVCVCGGGRGCRQSFHSQTSRPRGRTSKPDLQNCRPPGNPTLSFFAG